MFSTFEMNCGARQRMCHRKKKIMNSESPKHKKLKRITNCLIAPIRQQAPFIITWCLPMGSESIRAWNTGYNFP